MNIVAAGTAEQLNELKQKIASEHQLSLVQDAEITAIPDAVEILIDLRLHQQLLPQAYINFKGIVLVNGVFNKLAELAANSTSPLQCKLFGINSLPTLINRSLVEVSSLFIEQRIALEQVAAQLQWQLTWVDDRKGMVTPRILCMVINEAYYTLQEGTANKADIDLGMKLGTNYPAGPFEWAERIGLDNVYKVLSSTYSETMDERYKVCPLLYTELLHRNIHKA